MGFFDFLKKTKEVDVEKIKVYAETAKAYTETAKETFVLFKKVAGIAKEVYNAVADFATEAYKSIKDYFSSDSANESARNINNANADLSHNIGQMSAYDEQQATVSEIKKINDELGYFKSSASKEGETFEVALIDIGRKSIKRLARILADSGGNFAKQCEVEFEKLKGFVLSEIGSKISLGNTECTEILSKESGEAKRKEMNGFIDNAIKKAFRNLGDRFVDSVENNVNTMIKMLKSKLEMHKTLTNKQMATLEKIKEAQNVEQKQSEQVNLALDLNKKIAILNAIKGV